MGAFDHLLKLPEGAEDWSVNLSLKGFTPRQGGSGHVSPGRYKLRVTGTRVKSKRLDRGGGVDPTRKVIELRAETAEPSEFAGVPIISNWPAPREPNDIGHERLRQLAWSMASATGRLDTVMASEGFAFGGKKIVGQTFFAVLRDSTGDFAGRSEIDRCISAEEYGAKPGPDASIPAAVSRATEPPEVWPGALAAAPAAPSGDAKPSAEDILFG